VKALKREVYEEILARSPGSWWGTVSGRVKVEPNAFRKHSHKTWNFVFFQAPGDGDASSGAVSYIGYCAPCSGNTPKPQCGHKHTNRAGASLVPTRLVLPLSDMQRQRHWWSRLRSPERNQTSQCFRLSSENIGSIREACSRLQVVAFIVSVGDITNGIKAGIR